jgi:histidine triad (HIT) family protein
MQEPSVFTKIIRGEIPCHKIYEDDKTLAFLDIYAVVEGHTLVIPKKQVEFVWDLESEDYRAVMETTQKVARRLRDVLGVPYVGEKVVGTDVPHAHVHLVPFATADEYHRSGQENSEHPDHEALAALAKRLAF